MVNTKLQGEISCRICGYEYHWQDGLNDTRAVINLESKHTDSQLGSNCFDIELEYRCPECNYLYKEIITRQIKEYKSPLVRLKNKKELQK